MPGNHASIGDGTEARSETDRLALLLEVTNLLVTQRDLGALFEALSGCLGRTLKHELVAVALLSGPGTAVVRLAVADGVTFPALENQPIPVLEEAVAWMQRGNPILRSIEFIAQNNPVLHGIIAPLRMRTLCAIPLTRAGSTHGFLAVGSREQEAFGASDIALLQQVSGQITIAVENTLAHEEIRELKDRLVSEKLYLEDEIRLDHGFAGIIGDSDALREVLARVETVASTDATVLLTGETGTGKELVARAIHDRSRRQSRTFVRVNCAAMPSALVESEMFGHERGAFTGAVASRQGRFEIAHQGTLFLDEIGDLPSDVQPKLLRVLQEQEFEPLGGVRTRRVDVRVIAATNRDLSVMADVGTYRRDLFYRLNVFPIRLPALRERRQDIPALVRHFAQRYSQRLNRPIVRIPTADMERLCAWRWPGNIRELQNVVERAVILSKDGLLQVPVGEFQSSGDSGPERMDRLGELQRDAIVGALRDARGIVGGPDGAAARLGVKRTTLQSRMRKLGIHRPGF